MRTETAPEGGAAPMPMHGPHAFSRIRAPAATRSRMSPLSTRCSTTWRLPGLIVRWRFSAIVLPRSTAAATFMSSSDELVHDPMHTCWTAMAPISRIDFTAPGLCGMAASGSSAPRSISMISS